jgi:cell pole-organizing protein PopZ
MSAADNPTTDAARLKAVESTLADMAAAIAAMAQSQQAMAFAMQQQHEFLQRMADMEAADMAGEGGTH